MSDSTSRSPLQKFLVNIELWLSAAGLLVVWAIAGFVVPGDAGQWNVATFTALAVSVIHGITFWIVRRRQRRIRNELISEIREMLADVVKNQLAVASLWSQMSDDNIERVNGIAASLDQISEMVDGLSEESLRSWKRVYGEAIDNATAISSEDTSDPFLRKAV